MTIAADDGDQRRAELRVPARPPEARQDQVDLSGDAPFHQRAQAQAPFAPVKIR